MIFYFTGTGNSKWIAEEIGEKTKEKTHDIIKTEMTNELIAEIKESEYVGLVFPIYAWGTPKPMIEFIEKLPQIKGFTFAICTCGADCGFAAKKLNKLIPINASFSVVMPSNWVVGYDIESDEIIKRKIKIAKKKIESISKHIISKKEIYNVKEGSMSALKSSIVNWGFNNFMNNPKKYYATDDCISCGVCQFVCPARTITIEQGKPVWGNKCYQCMACINRCPQKAIQYGKKTVNRKRYYIDEWK